MKRYAVTLLLLLQTFLASMFVAKGQHLTDTFFLAPHTAAGHFWTQVGEKYHPAYELSNKAIHAYNNVSALVNKLVYNDISFRKRAVNCTLSIDGPLEISNCSFSEKNDTTDTDLSEIECGKGQILSFLYDGGITINYSRFPKDYPLILPQSSGNSFMTSDTLGSLYCNLKKRSLITANNLVYGTIQIDSSDVSDYVITLAGTRFMDSSGPVSIKNSRINAFLLIDSYGKNIQTDFYHDTLTGAVSIRNNKKVAVEEKLASHLQVNFEKCMINCAFVADYQAQASTILFKDCSFGPDANLSSLGFDTIIFNNCFNIPNPLLLTPDTSTQYSYLTLLNSNINNIKFDYNGKFILRFDSASAANPDLVSSTYENLLAKFKIEGKNASYKNIDIEYTQYRNQLNGSGGWLADSFSRYWWYYGYRKYYILYWSLFFLIVFVVINYKGWEAIQSVYPVIPIEKQGFFDRIKYYQHYKRKTLFNVFVFTAFIFFSLKVDFGKISYKNSRLLMYFFVQYLVGLVCVFFIANAILKLS